MTTPQSNRADAVAKLWDLKRMSDVHVGKGMPLIHFNLLLSDPGYRQGILDKAEALPDPQLRRQAQAIRQMDLREPLRHASPNGHGGGIAAPPGGIDMGGQRASAPPAAAGGRRGLILVALLLLTFGAGMWWWQQGSQDGGEILVSGGILENTLWRSGRTYVLDGMTYVEAGARLTIEPGVTVRGRLGSALIVTRDASLHARGRPDAPIVFTSAQPLGQRNTADWGGLVMLGNAPVNRDAHIEGIDRADSRGDFGGSDIDDSCGVLDYVRVEFAGFEIARDNELNGLTLGGCGRGTIVRNVQVHRGLDDGIEVFGGMVDLKNIVISGAGDDAFDWDMGWTGRVQNLIIQMHPDIGDNGFEGDNYSKAMDATPRSVPTFYNVTMINPPDSTKKHRVMTVRRGSGGRFYNMLLLGFDADLIDIRDAASARLADSGELDFGGLLVQPGPAPLFPPEDDDDGGFDEAAYFAAGRLHIVAASGLGAGAFDIAQPDFKPAAVQFSQATVEVPKGEFWDEAADYFGAIRPGSRRAWTDGWTAYPVN